MVAAKSVFREANIRPDILNIAINHVQCNHVASEHAYFFAVAVCS